MSIDRRKFLTKGWLATGALTGIGAAQQLVDAEAADEAAGEILALSPDSQLIMVQRTASRPVAPPSRAEIRAGIPGRKWIMVIDLAACDGCGIAARRAPEMHDIPADREWLRLYKLQDSPDTAPYWFPKPCFHYDDPPCARVCPVGATFKRQDGVALIDNERCIGCRFCMAACPYSARVFNWGRPQPPTKETAYSPERGTPRRTGTVEKCDFCPDHARHGLLPACPGSCQMGAIYFGDENEDAVTNGKNETVFLSALLRERAGYRYFEELGTHPRVYYLPPTPRRYPAPPKRAS